MIVDIRVKFILILLSNYLLLRRASDLVMALFVGLLCLLFVLAKQWQKGLHHLGIYTMLYVLYAFVMEHVSGYFHSFLSMLAIGGRLMFPCVMAGSYLFTTTSSRQFVTGLRHCKIPESIVLTFAIMFRFLPIVKQDYATIQQSLKIRGLFLNCWDMLKRPLTYGEYVLIPLLMSASRTAQDLTIATITKSIMGKNKTTFHPLCWHRQDSIVLSFCVLFIIVVERGIL